MATVEFIQKRLDGAKANLAKLQKKLERIEKAEATNWQVNPYYYGVADKRYTINEIDIAEKSIAKYEADLKTTAEKDNSRDVKVILEFLEAWKNRVYDYYDEAITAYYEESSEVKKLYQNIKCSYDFSSDEYKAYDEARLALRDKLYGYYEKESFTNRWGRPDFREVKVREGEYEYAKEYITRFSKYSEAVQKLRKDLAEEAKRKYDFIIERVNAICGTITDASNLSIGAKQDLNGRIIGDRGTASVKTIGAGGYNEGEIVNVKHGQCFHFRTLIHKV